MVTRRTFLSRAGLAAAAASGAPHIGRSAEALLAQPGQTPAKIIQIVSDGMSMGTLTCADALSHLLRKKGLSWINLLRDNATRQGLVCTRSLNSMVTDSSAASSAWGSGSRVVNGTLNMLPDGRKLRPLYPLFAEKSWARGLVTTAEVTHATPAGFAVSVGSRGDAPQIALQYFDQKIDVMLGGGRPAFVAKTRPDKRDLHAEFAAAGYAVVNDKAGLAAAPLDKPLLGTFADGHLPYTIDHLADPALVASVPTLAELTQAALARLENREHFILQVEGARIDHAAHNSDAPAALRDQIALDEAIDVCLDFQKRHPDTLIVMTTDHGNSNLGLNGAGSGYNASSKVFANVAGVKMSLPMILKLIEKTGKMQAVKPPEKEDDAPSAEPTKFTGAVETIEGLAIDPKKVQEILKEVAGYEVSDRRSKWFVSTIAGQTPPLYKQMDTAISQLGQLMANHLGIGWTGNTHTSDYVPVLAIGPGAEKFLGYHDNTDFFGIYTGLVGIDFKNPSVPLLADLDAGDPEQAWRYALA